MTKSFRRRYGFRVEAAGGLGSLAVEAATVIKCGLARENSKVAGACSDDRKHC
jgi:hypothetical protein